MGELAAAVRAVADAVQAVASSIPAAIETALAAVEQQLADTTGLLTGWADRQLDLIAPPLVRARRKVVQSLDRQMTDVYGYLLSAGVSYPMSDQVLYGITSGDYLGSVGLPSDPAAVAAWMASAPTPGSTAAPVATPNAGLEPLPASVWPSALPMPGSTAAAPTPALTPNDPATAAPTAVPPAASAPYVPGGGFTPATPGAPWGGAGGGMPPLPGGLAAQIAAGVAAGIAGAGPQCCPAPEDGWPALPPAPASTTPAAPIPTTPAAPTSAMEPLPAQPAVPGAVGGDAPSGAAGSVTAAAAVTTTCPPVGRGVNWGRVPIDCDDVRRGSGGRCSDDSILGFGEQGHAPHWWQVAVHALPGWLQRGLTGVMMGIDRAMSGIMDEVGDIAGCVLGRPALFRWILGLIDGICGGALKPYLRGMDQTAAAACPQEIPSPAEATDAYLAGTIDRETWRCWTAAGNHHVGPATAVMRARRARPDLRSLVRLWRMGQLGEGEAGEAAFYEAARQLGYIDRVDLDRSVAAMTAMPSLSDIIRYMVRDAADDAVAKEYGLDSEFDAKFAGALRAWAAAQNIPENVARMAWRAHWRIPSDTQLFEMLHRLRPPAPGEVGPDADRRRKLAVTPAVVARALSINDLAPEWQDRLMAISYHPLTRVDVRRAYEMGLLTEDDVRANYLDLGYTEADADRLTAFARREREMHDLQLARSIGPDYRKLYQDGVITEEELRRELIPFAPGRLDVVDRAVEIELKERHYRRRAADIECVRTEYVRGWIRDAEALRQLVAHGVHPRLADEHISRWKCAMLPQRKHMSAAELCDLRERGLIDAGAHLQGLVNLGWSPADAQRITDQCLTAAADKATKKQIAEMRRQYREEQKAAKEAAAAERRRRREERAAAKRKCQEDRAAQAGKPPPC
jgi:hypothetical protein